MIRRIRLALLNATLLVSVALAATPSGSTDPAQGRRIDSAADYSVLAPHARVEPENRILTERLEHLLPTLMTETGLDMWVVVNREYAEDPVYFTLVPQPSFAARRTTMLVFSRAADGKVERLAVNRYPLGAPYQSAWSGGDLDAQWQALGGLIASRNPQRIGIDVSATWAAADGLTHALHERLVSVLPPDYVRRLVSAEDLVVRWIETRTPAEQALYPHIDSITRGVIAEAFSSRVITPGVTTTDEVAWYIRERFESLGLRPWFMPTVDRQRAGEPGRQQMQQHHQHRGAAKTSQRQPAAILRRSHWLPGSVSIRELQSISWVIGWSAMGGSRSRSEVWPASCSSAARRLVE